MLGIITEVTVRVKEKFMLEEFQTHHSLDYCMKELDDLVQNSGNILNFGLSSTITFASYSGQIK